MTRNGAAYVLPTWAHLMAASASSASQPSETPDTLLMTPVAQEANANRSAAQRAEQGRQVWLTGQVMDLLPTPLTTDTKGSAPADAERNAPQLRAIDRPLPTPLTTDNRGSSSPADMKRHDPGLRAIDQLLPTVTAPAPHDTDHTAGALRERRPGYGLELTTMFSEDGRLLPTPGANIGDNGGSQHPEKRRAGNHQASIQDVAEHVLLPTPITSDQYNARTDGDHQLRGVNQLLATPRAANGCCQSPIREAGAIGNPDGRLEDQIALLPTVRAQNGENRNNLIYERDAPQQNIENALPGQAKDIATNWGPYEPAIRRWEHITRPAPPPTKIKRGKHRLNPRFAEWMMGVPDGWITDTPGITDNEQLKAAGNGVVPQQAAAALKHMLNTGSRAASIPNRTHQTNNLRTQCGVI